LARLTGSVNSKQARIRWCPVPAYCPGRSSHNVARLRLACCAAGFYEQLTFNHEIVVAVRMLIRPRLRSQTTQAAQAQTNHFALAARLPHISVRRARSTRFARILSACSLPLPFTSYVEPWTWSICGESCAHGNKRILEDRSRDLVRLWDARGGGPITLRNGPLCTVDLDFPRHSYDLVSREVLTARVVEHVKAPNSSDTASIAGELRQ